MAIVRTTPKETASGEPLKNGAPAEPVARDATRSVVRQTGRPVAPRAPVGVRPPAQSASRAQESPVSVQDTMTELRRVVWPSKEQVTSGTVITILLLVFFAAYIFGLEQAITWLFTTLGLYPNAPTS